LSDRGGDRWQAECQIYNRATARKDVNTKGIGVAARLTGETTGGGGFSSMRRRGDGMLAGSGERRYCRPAGFGFGDATTVSIAA
jgi:hypothetical protein